MHHYNKSNGPNGNSTREDSVLLSLCVFMHISTELFLYSLNIQTTQVTTYMTCLEDGLWTNNITRLKITIEVKYIIENQSYVLLWSWRISSATNTCIPYLNTVVIPSEMTWLGDNYPITVLKIELRNQLSRLSTLVGPNWASH